MIISAISAIFYFYAVVLDLPVLVDQEAHTHTERIRQSVKGPTVHARHYPSYI